MKCLNALIGSFPRSNHGTVPLGRIIQNIFDFLCILPICDWWNIGTTWNGFPVVYWHVIRPINGTVYEQFEYK